MIDFNNAGPLVAELTLDERTERVKRSLDGRVRSFVTSILPRSKCSASEARVGSIDGEPGGSLSISLRGDDAGAWFDHATHEQGGDLISLYQAAMNCDFMTALQEMEAWTGTQVHQPRAKQVITERVARHVHKPDAPDDVKKALDTFYEYKHKDGSPNAKVYRYLNSDGSKTFRMRRADGAWKAPEDRTLYRLEAFHDKPDVVIVEGEKCVEALESVGIVATSQMGGSGASLELTDWTPLAGKRVTLWPDNDVPGTEFMERVAAKLSGLGCDVSLVPIPLSAPKGWDAADALEDGLDLGAMIKAAQDGLQKPAWELSSFEDGEIPPMRDFVYEPLLIGGCLTVIPAPPGTGKTTFSLQLAVCYAMGIPFAGCIPTTQGNVLIINGEEPEFEIRRRYMAACVEHGISELECAPRVKWVSGYDIETGVTLAVYDSKTQHVKRGLDVDKIIEAARSINAKLIILDPAAELAKIEENSNAQQGDFAKIMRGIGRETGAAMLAFTHTPKNSTGDNAGDPYTIRGGGSMVGVARVVATLFNMTPADAKHLGIQQGQEKLYARFDMGKANMSDPTGSGVNWFKKIPHTIASGDVVATLKPIDLVPPSILKEQDEMAQADKFLMDLAADLVDVLERAGGACTVSYYSRNADHDRLQFKDGALRNRVPKALENGPLEYAGKRVILLENQGKLGLKLEDAE